MLLATWNVFSIPYIVAFVPHFEEPISLKVFNLLIDFLFFIDIVLNFRTTFFNSVTGDEISKPKKIAQNYIISGKFLLDVLASVPFDVLGNIFISESKQGQNFALLGLLKMIRITRIGRIITYMRAKEDMKVTLKLLQLGYFLCIYIHFVACL